MTGAAADRPRAGGSGRGRTRLRAVAGLGSLGAGRSGVAVGAVRDVGPGGHLTRHQVGTDGYVLSTIHRAGTVDDPGRLRAALEALAGLAGHTQVLLPLMKGE